MTEYKIKIKALTDIMPGSGESVPGLVDSDSKYDNNGFPFMSAKTFKGHVREQMENVAAWTNTDVDPNTLLGQSDIESEKKQGKLKFSDVVLSDALKKTILEYAKSENVTKDELIDAITTIFAFTKIGENGVAECYSAN